MHCEHNVLKYIHESRWCCRMDSGYFVARSPGAKSWPASRSAPRRALTDPHPLCFYVPLTSPNESDPLTTRHHRYHHLSSLSLFLSPSLSLTIYLPLPSSTKGSWKACVAGFADIRQRSVQILLDIEYFTGNILFFNNNRCIYKD